jgi:uncharacterized protein YkwD
MGKVKRTLMVVISVLTAGTAAVGASIAAPESARAHSKDMIRRDYFSHNTKGRGSFEKRLVRFDYGTAGYDYYRVGENIALGSGPAGEPESRMNAWMKSDGHRHNILNDEYREVGIGTHTGKFKDFAGVTMYTVDFGIRRK